MSETSRQARKRRARNGAGEAEATVDALLLGPLGTKRINVGKRLRKGDEKELNAQQEMI